jgi:hypothetical protein
MTWWKNKNIIRLSWQFSILLLFKLDTFWAAAGLHVSSLLNIKCKCSPGGHAVLSASCALRLRLHTFALHINTKKKLTPWPESASELYRQHDRRLSAMLVPKFADTGCHVVGVTNAYGRNFGPLYRRRYFFFQVAPQFVLTRLSGPRYRPTTSQKIWQRQESNPRPLAL